MKGYLFFVGEASCRELHNDPDKVIAARCRSHNLVLHLLIFILIEINLPSF